ncbi:MAG: metal-dependent hydrolase, partial [Acidimicrobiia bacterium]
MDKPVGSLLWKDRFGTGRLWGHTLVFSVVLLVAVIMLTRPATVVRRQWLGLPIGTLLHLVLDGMWSSPETGWWPLAGSSLLVMEPSTLGGLA